MSDLEMKKAEERQRELLISWGGDNTSLQDDMNERSGDAEWVN